MGRRTSLMIRLCVLAAGLHLCFTLEVLEVNEPLLLEAKLSNATFRYTLFDSAAYYDGEDSVYLFGGNSDGGYSRSIYRFSVSKDKIELVSTLNHLTLGGLALMGTRNDTESDIYFFGGVKRPRGIERFDPKTNTTTVVVNASLPVDVQLDGGVTDHKGLCYIFSGTNGCVIEFDAESGTSKVVAELPFGNTGAIPIESTTVFHDERGNRVWVFAENWPKPLNPVLLFDLETKEVSVPAMNFSSLPRLYVHPATVVDGRYGYFVGGIGRALEEDLSYHPGNGIIRFDMENGSTEFLPVVNYPAGAEEYLDGTSAVLLKGLFNRIYIFGGKTSDRFDSKYHDSIWYIDLPPPTLN